MHYEFHPDALEEYLQATTWYRQRDSHVARQFVAAIESAISRLLTAPNRFRVIDEEIRRCLTHKFPYAVLYTIEADHVLILAVMHCSREPGYWKDRR